MAEVLIRSFLSGLTPEPKMTVTQWANAHRKLSSKGSAEPGQYNVNRTPYLRKIMDMLSMGSGVQRVVFEKGSQVGATEVGFNLIGYCIDAVPCAIMYLMPTVDTMERNVKQRIDPMIDECPRLQMKVGKRRSKDGGNTLAQKDFPGGALFLTGANSAAGLSSIPVRVAILDEVDRYPDDVDDEGDPASLVMRRMSTFGDSKKVFMPSTPTIEDASRVDREFKLTDQQYYYVPCPHCFEKAETRGIKFSTEEHTALTREAAGMQILSREQLRWEPGKWDDVYYECIHCQGKIYNRHKTWMLREIKYGGYAEWIETCPENRNPKVMGFHLASYYSPDGWMSFNEIAEEWDKSEGDEPKRKAFINTIDGKTYKVKGDAPPWQMLFERATADGNARNEVWDSVAFITAGADVQADRIEVNIVGWMKGRISQQVDYRVLDGDTTKPEVWAQLEQVMADTWEWGSRKEGIRMLALDANYNASFSHDFARKYGTRRVIPVQGREALEMPFSNPKALTKTKLGKKLPKGKVWPVGVSYLKSQLYGWLRQTIKDDGVVPKGYCHLLPMEEPFFRGLCAEELVAIRSKRTNVVKYEWQVKYKRNEPLDTMIYAMAAAYVLGFDRWNDARWEKETKGVRGSAGAGKRAGSGERGAEGSEQEMTESVTKEAESVTKVADSDNKVAVEDGKLKKKRRSKGGFWS